LSERTENSTPQVTRKSWNGRLARLLRNAIVCYLGIIIVMLFLENKLIFRPVRASEDWLKPPNVLVQDVEMWIADGTKIHGWWCPVPDGESERGALLYCHGNAGNLSWRSEAIARWQKEMNQSVLIFDYPGFGRSEGYPSEAACYAAADAAYDWLVKIQHVSANRLIIFGKSLGGGVAVDLASRRTHAALILVKTFTSMADEAQSVCPVLPARWLVRTRFDNLGKIKKCTQPIFIAHGTADRLIPFSFSQRLFDAANEPKRFCSMEGIDHNDALLPDFYRSLRDFLAVCATRQSVAHVSRN